MFFVGHDRTRDIFLHHPTPSLWMVFPFDLNSKVSTTTAAKDRHGSSCIITEYAGTCRRYKVNKHNSVTVLITP